MEKLDLNQATMGLIAMQTNHHVPPGVRDLMQATKHTTNYLIISKRNRKRGKLGKHLGRISHLLMETMEIGKRVREPVKTNKIQNIAMIIILEIPQTSKRNLTRNSIWMTKIAKGLIE